MSPFTSGRPLAALVLFAALALGAPQAARGLFLKNTLKKVKQATKSAGKAIKDTAKTVGGKMKGAATATLAGLETGWNAVRTFTDPTGYLVSCFKGAVGAKHTLKGPCNGSEKLCGKRYNEVVQLMTHNSMAALRYPWAPGYANHCSKMTRQLDDGVRGFMLDTHMDGGRPALCHGSCKAGKIDLVAGLKEFATWLAANRRQVVTFNLESGVSGAVFQKALRDAGLYTYVYAHEKGKAWPTLGELIKAGKRLVLFTSKDGGAFPGYHAVSSFTSENDYAWKKESEFGCKKRHENAGAPYTLNHFLTNPTGAPHLAVRANTKASIVRHARKCQQEKGSKPTFVAVDWYELGEGFRAIQELNGI